MDPVWHDLLTGVLAVSLFPAGLVLLAWRDWKTATGETDPIGRVGTSILALETAAALALPPLALHLWRGALADLHVVEDIVLGGLSFWLIAIPVTAIWAGKARRYLISACVISFFICSLGAAGA